MDTIIQTPTCDLAESISYYSKLGFSVSEHNEKVVVSDGSVLIMVNPSRYARTGLRLYSESWYKTVQVLEKVTTVEKIENGYLISDPSGVWVYLIEGDSGIDHSGKPSVLGNLAGICIETIGIKTSIDIWEVLGFKMISGSVEDGFVCLERGGLKLNLMKANCCPHLFFNPSLTYFNGKENMKVIDKVRNLDIPIAEEITYFNKEGIVDNIILRDPGGLGCFVFND